MRGWNDRLLRGGLWYYGNVDEVALVTLSIMFYCFYVIILVSLISCGIRVFDRLKYNNEIFDEMNDH